MPLVLVLPTAALAAVAAGVWRLDRRVRADVAALTDARRRLASIRAAVVALGAQVDDAGLRRGALASEADPTRT